MDVSNLETGLKIFLVGFPGVFANLMVIALLIYFVGKAVSRWETRAQAQTQEQRKN